MDVVYLHSPGTTGTIDADDWTGFLAKLAGKKTVVAFHHGWMTDEASFLTLNAGMVDGLSSRFGDDTLYVGLHWTSDSPWGELSYWDKESLALTIGHTAAYEIAAAALKAGANLIVVGHSFGCIVSAESVADLAEDGVDRRGQNIRLVLLQAAFPNDLLEEGEIFGADDRLYPLIDVTVSHLDRALGEAFPIAEHLEARKDCAALGFAGPTAATVTEYDNGKGKRLRVTDISAAQAAHPLNDPFSGEHSNILLPIVFDLIAG